MIYDGFQVVFDPKKGSKKGSFLTPKKGVKKAPKKGPKSTQNRPDPHKNTVLSILPSSLHEKWPQKVTFLSKTHHLEGFLELGGSKKQAIFDPLGRGAES